MRRFDNYIEGAASIFELFAERAPRQLVLPKRPRMTVAQAFAKDAKAIRGDVRRALGKALNDAR